MALMDIENILFITIIIITIIIVFVVIINYY